MAVDEAVLGAVAERLVPPTLRFFAWTPPCLSLGYAQPAGDVDLERLRERGWGLVRRPTGGRAILHTDELTYSVIAPMDEPRVAGGVVESYRLLSAGLLRGLEILGLQAAADQNPKSKIQNPKSAGPICFEVPSDYEVTAGGRKLLGSAQVRRRGVVLQHGTLPLAGDITRICDVLRAETETQREALRQRVRARATTLAEVIGKEIAWDEAAAAVARGFAEALNLTLERGDLLEEETAQAAELHAVRFAAAVWTQRV